MCSSIYIFTAECTHGFGCYSPSFKVGTRCKCVVCWSKTKESKVSWHCHQRGPRKVMLSKVYPSTLKLQLYSFGEGLAVINWFVGVWNTSLIMFWRFFTRDFWCGGVFKPMPVMIAVSFLQDKTVSSTFQVPVSTLRTYPEKKILRASQK